MSKLRNRSGDIRSPPLRVVYGDEETNQAVEHQVKSGKTARGCRRIFYAGPRPA
jgi:hypothetical protein